LLRRPLPGTGAHRRPGQAPTGRVPDGSGAGPRPAVHPAGRPELVDGLEEHLDGREPQPVRLPDLHRRHPPHGPAMTAADTDGARRPGRRAARGREEVLAGASRVIARRGADATRYADVAAETGTAISTLQYSFGSRADLVIAALRETHRADVALVET